MKLDNKLHYKRIWSKIKHNKINVQLKIKIQKFISHRSHEATGPPQWSGITNNTAYLGGGILLIKWLCKKRYQPICFVFASGTNYSGQ